MKPYLCCAAESLSVLGWVTRDPHFPIRLQRIRIRATELAAPSSCLACNLLILPPHPPQPTTATTTFSAQPAPCDTSCWGGWRTRLFKHSGKLSNKDTCSTINTQPSTVGGPISAMVMRSIAHVSASSNTYRGNAQQIAFLRRPAWPGKKSWLWRNRIRITPDLDPPSLLTLLPRAGCWYCLWRQWPDPRRDNAQWAKSGFFVQWVYWMCLFSQNTCPLCNAAMYEQV